jgi:hypothetical protein
VLTSVNRRGLLRFGTVQLGGLWLPSLLQERAAAAGETSPRPRAKACILLFMDGGPSQIDMWDMKPEAPSDIRGPFTPIRSTVPGLQVCEHLPLMARQMHRVTVVRSMQHAELVHPPAVTCALTGFAPSRTAGGNGRRDRLPHLGAAFGKADPTPCVVPKVISLPEVMKIDALVIPGQDAGYLGAASDPLLVEVTPGSEVRKPDVFQPAGRLTPERLARRGTLLDQVRERQTQLEPYRELDALQQRAFAMLSGVRISDAFDLARESAKLRDRYGRHRQGQCTLLARRLVEAGVRFVSVYWGREKQYWGDGNHERVVNNPWDGHRNHFPICKDDLFPRADQAFSALLEDLAARGLLEETLVVWMGEFGRAPRIGEVTDNAGTDKTGRDHWPFAYSVVLAGGGMPAGAVYGATDGTSSQITENPVTPADLTATMLQALGVDPRQMVRDPENRPVRLTEGTPIRALLA